MAKIYDSYKDCDLANVVVAQLMGEGYMSYCVERDDGLWVVYIVD